MKSLSAVKSPLDAEEPAAIASTFEGDVALADFAIRKREKKRPIDDNFRITPPWSQQDDGKISIGNLIEPGSALYSIPWLTME
ncbi:MAG: hypothetical protein ACXWSD_18630 [Bdellovibrionota bacterium]